MSPRRKRSRPTASDRRIAALQGQAAAESADKLGVNPETGEPLESSEGKARTSPPENKARSGAESKS